MPGIEGGACTATLLRYEVVDKDLISEVAKSARVDEEQVEEFDEHEVLGLRGLLLRWFTDPKQYAASGGVAYGSGLDFVPFFADEDDDGTEESPFLDRWQYHDTMAATITRLAKRGKVIIMGRGSGLILKQRDDVIRVRIVADEASRVKRLAALEQTDEQSAHSRIKDSDRCRAAYIKRNFHEDWADPALYHFVINTEHASVAAAAEIIAAGVKKLFWRSSSHRSTARISPTA